MQHTVAVSLLVAILTLVPSSASPEYRREDDHGPHSRHITGSSENALKVLPEVYLGSPVRSNTHSRRANAEKRSKSGKTDHPLDWCPEESSSTKASKAKASKAKASKADCLHDINSIVDIAFPMWEIDEDGKRVETNSCTVESCEWNPFYVTKRYDGLHPDFGGHPTDNDVKYAFFASSPFEGQPYPGTPHHCPMDALDDIKIGDCPKIETVSDTGPHGPGHVPPHIALASLLWGVDEELLSVDEMFDYDSYECRVIPGVLFNMIREYFPRTEGEKVAYPPPIVPEGGDFQYEFPGGNGLDNQEPPYAPGPPHWCTEEMFASGHWDGVCPYIFEGPDAGKYRHPHIALASLEVYLANKAMPAKCATTWLENNPDFLDPDRVTMETPFPVMSNDGADSKTVENWLGQPVLPWEYDSGNARLGAVIMSAEDSVDFISNV